MDERGPPNFSAAPRLAEVLRRSERDPYAEPHLSFVRLAVQLPKACSTSSAMERRRNAALLARRPGWQLPRHQRQVSDIDDSVRVRISARVESNVIHSKPK